MKVVADGRPPPPPRAPTNGKFMPYDPEIHHRRSIRLKGYDYSQAGAYFITICTHNRECLFGEIIDGQMHLNEIGKIVESEWLKTAEIRDEVELDAFTVMPNHVHGIIVITGNAGTTEPVGAHGGAPNVNMIADDWGSDTVGADGRPPLRRQPKSLGSIIAGFKSTATKQINEIRRIPGAPVWQRNYYEHIIRNEKALYRIQRYIIENPQQWLYDQENRNEISDEDKKQFWKKHLG